MADENQTQTSTQTAGETATNIQDVMGGMQQKPDAKPADNGGDKAAGSNEGGSGNGGYYWDESWFVSPDFRFTESSA